MDGTRAAAVRAGAWKRQVDPGEARAHLARYVEAAGRYGGIGAAVRATGLSLGGLKELLYGNRAQIMAETHDAIMALELPALRVPPAGSVYPHGTRRRIHAMAAIGVPMTHLSAMTGLKRMQDTARSEFVLQRTADAIRAAVEQLAADPDRPYVSRTATLAARAVCVECPDGHLGHHPLGWWYDIDDPGDVPPPAPPAHLDVDPVLVEQMLQGRARRPACFGRIRSGMHTVTCVECIRWKANRDAAIRYGTSRGMSAERLGVAMGESTRNVQRVRADQVLEGLAVAA